MKKGKYSEMMMMKNPIRTTYRNIRRNLLDSRRKEAEKNAKQELLSFLPNRGLVLSYMSLKEELSLNAFNALLASQNRLVLPTVCNNEIRCYRVDNPAGQLQLSSYGIWEPIPEKSTEVAPEQIALGVIPGLAFDLDYYRLGYGKGYFDRLLTGLTIPTIGVGFREQLCLIPLPREEHDIPLNELILV